MTSGLNRNDMKTVSDIYVHDGTSWVSVKGGNIKVHNGTGFVALGTVNSPIYDGSEWCHVENTQATFETRQDVHLTQSTPSISFPFTAVPSGDVSVVSKPLNLNVSVNNTTKIITYSYTQYTSNWYGDVVLHCTNGAPDLTVHVSELLQ